MVERRAHLATAPDGAQFLVEEFVEDGERIKFTVAHRDAPPWHAWSPPWTLSEAP
jgi:hypothetical protein